MRFILQKVDTLSATDYLLVESKSTGLGSGLSGSSVASSHVKEHARLTQAGSPLGTAVASTSVGPECSTASEEVERPNLKSVLRILYVILFRRHRQSLQAMDDAPKIAPLKLHLRRNQGASSV